ncbi:MAG: ketoacyl-ACP synthase III [Phycisphaerales bacterium]|nr:ketoacyl-ACP synthase III [Phycisphaerales bacterium]
MTPPQPAPGARPLPSRPPSRAAPKAVGVRIAGTGSALPSRVLTNADLERMMDTSDEWIVQRTGIRTRYIADRAKGESSYSLSATALTLALESAGLEAKDLDLLIVATMTPEMSCPPTACRVLEAIGGPQAGAFDLSGACCGFVFGLNCAHDLIKSGAYRTVGLVGCDTLSKYMDYSDAGRSTAIIFGDGAGAVVLRATDDTDKGIISQAMHADGGGWKHIYVPECDMDFPCGVAPDPGKLCTVQMNGSQVFKFAVGTFPELIQQTLDKAGLTAADVDMFVCHQSNARILQAARERFGLPEEKLYVNIDRYGNTVAASVPLCLDELRRGGRVRDGHKVMFVAFGGGLTWGSSLWQL